MDDGDSVVTLTDVIDAYKRIRTTHLLVETPLIQSPQLDELTNCSVFFKCEMFQRSGSFKARGAVNALLVLAEKAKAQGSGLESVVVCTHSSGNHGSALSYAATAAGAKAIVVVPSDAPEGKKKAIQSFGAQLVLCPPGVPAREAACATIVADKGAVFVHPSNSPAMIEGGASVGIEMLQQFCGHPVRPFVSPADFSHHNAFDVILCPLGGAGLLSGLTIAVKGLSPNTRVIGVEPANADDAFRSRLEGKLLTHSRPVSSVADGLLTTLGSRTFPVVRDMVDDVITVTEAEILRATKIVWETLKVVAEPSSCVGLAALMAERHQSTIRKVVARPRVGIVLSGGNGLDFAPFFEAKYKSKV